MGQRFLLDTNILIYYIKTQIPIDKKVMVKEILLKSFNVSVITVIEFLDWREYDENSFTEAKELIDNAQIFHLNDKIISLSIDLKRNYNLKLGDAIIAATSIANDLVLVTRNEKDFVRLQDIKLLNPFNG